MFLIFPVPTVFPTRKTHNKIAEFLDELSYSKTDENNIGLQIEFIRQARNALDDLQILIAILLKNIPDEATCAQLALLETQLCRALSQHWQRLKEPAEYTQASDCQALRSSLDLFKKNSLPNLSNKIMYGYHMTSDLIITGASIALIAFALTIPFTVTGAGAFFSMGVLLLLGAAVAALYGYSLYQNARFACGRQINQIEQLTDMLDESRPQP
jgi:hypothetical protein